MTPALLLSAFLGSYTLYILSEALVTWFVIVVCGFGFLYMLFKPTIQYQEKSDFIKNWKLASIGTSFFMGAYDGVSGAGGGIIRLEASLEYDTAYVGQQLILRYDIITKVCDWHS